MFKRILIATDGSDYSRRAFKTAVQIAEKFDAVVELLHVADSSVAGSGVADMDGQYLVSAEDIAEFSKTIMDRTTANIDVSVIKIGYKTIPGKPAAVILEELRRDFDLAVLGTRGLKPWAGAVLGSVAQRVVAESPCPVLIVK